MEGRNAEFMVEAVGIEPTSESLQQQNLHAYPAFFLYILSAIEAGKRTDRTPGQ